MWSAVWPRTRSVPLPHLKGWRPVAVDRNEPVPMRTVRPSVLPFGHKKVDNLSPSTRQGSMHKQEKSLQKTSFLRTPKGWSLFHWHVSNQRSECRFSTVNKIYIKVWRGRGCDDVIYYTYMKWSVVIKCVWYIAIFARNIQNMQSTSKSVALNSS
jgi:hypothetical protein